MKESPQAARRVEIKILWCYVIKREDSDVFL